MLVWCREAESEMSCITFTAMQSADAITLYSYIQLPSCILSKVYTSHSSIQTRFLLYGDIPITCAKIAIGYTPLFYLECIAHNIPCIVEYITYMHMHTYAKKDAHMLLSQSAVCTMCVCVSLLLLI